MGIYVATAIRLGCVNDNNGDTQSALHLILKEEHLEVAKLLQVLA